MLAKKIQIFNKRARYTKLVGINGIHPVKEGSYMTVDSMLLVI